MHALPQIAGVFIKRNPEREAFVRDREIQNRFRIRLTCDVINCRFMILLLALTALRARNDTNAEAEYEKLYRGPARFGARYQELTQQERELYQKRHDLTAERDAKMKRGKSLTPKEEAYFKAEEGKIAKAIEKVREALRQLRAQNINDMPDDTPTPAPAKKRKDSREDSL
jgi:hypothetical protein